MEKLKQQFSKIKIPQGSDLVYKDECMYSFDCPVSKKFLLKIITVYF